MANAEKVYWTINKKEDFSYCQDEILGEGQVSYVFLGKFKTEEVAVKRIQLATLRKDLGLQRETDNLRLLQRELQHEHIVKLLYFDTDDTFRYIALERCKTDLKQYVSSPEYDRVLTNESVQIKVLLQLTEALQFIHSKKLLHRDIKPANILVSSNQFSVIMKWADFGHSKQTNDNGSASMSEPRGTINWLAPEIIKYLNKIESTAHSSRKSDIFSAGCVFFFFLTKGVHPYGDNQWDLLQNILDGKMKNKNRLKNGHRAKLTVLKMMKKQVENRLGLEEVISQLKMDK